MEHLEEAQRQSLQKTNTDRLRAKLVKLGYDEELIFASERDALLNMMAEELLHPKLQVEAKARPTDPTTEVRLREIALREQELSTRLEMQRMQLEAEKQQREAELELRKDEARAVAKRAEEDLELRRQEIERLRARDEQTLERESSLC